MNRIARTPAISLLALAISAVSLPVAADESALIEKLEQKGVLSAQEAAELRNEMDTDGAEQERGYVKADDVEGEKTKTRVRRFTVSDEDGENIFRVRGRVMLDGEIADFDEELEEIANNGDKIPEYGTTVRRARLGVRGRMYENFEWQLETDFRESNVRFGNVYLAYLMDEGRLAVGNFKEPFSLESETSSRYTTFMERAAPVDAYRPSPSRSLGIMYQTVKPRYYLAAGLFGGNLNEEIDNERDKIEKGYGFAGRASFAPYFEDGNFAHIGASYAWRQNATLGDSWLTTDLRTREGARGVDIQLIGEQQIPGVEDYARYALEAAFGYGPFSVQAEYLAVNLTNDPDNPVSPKPGGGTETADNPDTDITQDGFYIQGSYFLTGESRNYRPSAGDFGRITPNRNFNPASGDWGAFEVALRYADADSSEATKMDDGQTLEHWTLGLNWYLNPEMLVKFNAMRFDATRNGLPDGSGTVFASRLQYEF